MRVAGAIVGALLELTTAIPAATADAVANPAVDPTGTVSMSATKLPFSEFASQAARDAFIADAHHAPGPKIADGDSKASRANDAKENAPRIARMRALWPVTITPTTIGGVYTEVIAPVGGPRLENAHRVLIELHGGGFVGCPRTCGQIESIPIAGVGGFTVVAVDYRQGPEYRFPAASEDVAAVYRELLKDHRPQDIGIFGGSAGGLLTAEALAWLQHVGLPRPGAVAIAFAGAGGWLGGDSNYLSFPSLGQERWGGDGPHRAVSGAVYLEHADMRDPLVAPVWTAAVLAKFPPTLLVTASRDFAMSSATNTARALDAVGVPHELAVWDGLSHYFYNAPDWPESREVYAKISRWFGDRLGRQR